MLPRHYDWEAPGALLTGMLDVQERVASYLAYSLSQRGIDISFERLKLLQLIEREGPYTPSTLAARLGVARASVTGALSALGSYIETHPAPDDRRSFLIQASQRGKVLLAESHTIVLQVEQELFGLLPRSSLPKLYSAMKLVNLRFRDIDARAPVDVRKRTLRRQTKVTRGA